MPEVKPQFVGRTTQRVVTEERRNEGSEGENERHKGEIATGRRK
jgi:hypothetical protein